MDAFSELLANVKLNGAFYFNGEFSAPWGACTPESAALATLLSPGATQLVIYHLVVEGRAYAHTANRQSLTLDAGDVVVFPHGDAHYMTSEPGSIDCLDSAAIIAKVRARDLSPLRVGGGGATARVVCGFMACDPHLGRSVLAGLPPFFKVSLRNDPGGAWLESSIRHLVNEAASGRPGGEALLAKLSETLFIETLRRHVSALPPEQSGWLAGARDSVVGKCLRLLHSSPDRAWTLAGLAREAGVSRSALAERFTRYLGEPPMAYLTRWRLGSAARVLAKTQKSVAEVAAEAGYESEAAFSRAFKREIGLPPARYRRDALMALAS